MSIVTARKYVEVGAKIRAARLSSGFSQERFAPVIGITRRHLIRLENGEHHPSPELRQRIAEATGTPADELLNGSADDAEAVQVAPAAAGLQMVNDLIRRLQPWDGVTERRRTA